jgi:peptidoglycan hydrolase CwlO-like protein
MHSRPKRFAAIVVAVTTALGIGFALGNAGTAAGSSTRADTTIRKLSREVSRLQHRVTAVESHVTTLTSGLKTAHSNVTTLRSDLNATKEKVILLQQSTGDLDSRMSAICQNGQLVTNVDFATQTDATVLCR